MDKSGDLRKILSQNIRNARSALHISQAKLAEFAGISVPYMVDIEYCKTWVSDKTLANIAAALNMKAYELLIPHGEEQTGDSGQEDRVLRRTARLVTAKKSLLRKQAAEAMDDLIMEIAKMYGE